MAAERTNVSTYRQTLLYNLTAFEAFLGGEARIDSYHPMTSSLSLFFEDVEKCAPTSVHDALCQGMILDHIENLELLNSDDLVMFSIVFSRLIVKVTTLTSNLEMRLRGALGSLTASMTAFLASAYRTLLASQGLLRATIESGVLNRMLFRVSQEHFQTNIKTNLRMGAHRWFMLSPWLHLTYNECIPMSISTQDKMDGFRLALYRAVQLDLQEVTQLLGNNEVLLVLVHIPIFSILPQLDRVPLVALLEAWEAYFHSKLFAGKKTFEGLRETVSKHLYCCSRYMLSTSSNKYLRQIILAGECAFLFILCFSDLKHLIVKDARLTQTVYEQGMLLLRDEKAILKRFHTSSYMRLESVCQQCRPPRGGRQFITMAEARAPLPHFGSNLL